MTDDVKIIMLRVDMSWIVEAMMNKHITAGEGGALICLAHRKWGTTPDMRPADDGVAAATYLTTDPEPARCPDCGEYLGDFGCVTVGCEP